MLRLVVTANVALIAAAIVAESLAQIALGVKRANTKIFDMFVNLSRAARVAARSFGHPPPR